MRVELERLSANSLDEMIELERGAEQHLWSRAQLVDELEHGLVFGARQAGALVGHAFFRQQTNEWWLMQLRVREDARRNGVGRALLEEGFKNAPESCDEIWLEVAVDNDAAIALYRGLGFVDRGVRPRYYARVLDALIMNRAALIRGAFGS